MYCQKQSLFSSKDRLSHGQGLVELALLIPLLLLIVFGAVDLARGYQAVITITNASREGARHAMRVNTSPGTDAEKLQEIQDFAVDEASTLGITLLPGDVSVVCAGAAYNPPCPSGSVIRVTVAYDFDLLMGAYFIPSINLSRFTEMVAP